MLSVTGGSSHLVSTFGVDGGNLTELSSSPGRVAGWRSPNRPHNTQDREVLLNEMSASTGLTGQSRRGGSTDERARVAVRKAITAAIDKTADGRCIPRTFTRRHLLDGILVPVRARPRPFGYVAT
jgi:hypothetical protein